LHFNFCFRDNVRRIRNALPEAFRKLLLRPAIARNSKDPDLARVHERNRRELKHANEPKMPDAAKG